MKLEVKNELKNRFYVLRALQGKSYDTIARELEVSKPTLIKWEREAREVFTILQEFRIREVLADYQFGVENRLSVLIELAQKFKDELLKRDYDEVPSNKLTEMLSITLKSIGEIELNHSLSSSSYDAYNPMTGNFFTKD